jgi:hypothetical protein
VTDLQQRLVKPVRDRGSTSNDDHDPSALPEAGLQTRQGVPPCAIRRAGGFGIEM